MMKKRSLQDWRARPRNAISMYPGMYTMRYLTTPAGVKEYGMGVRSIIAVYGEKEFEFFIETKEDCERLGMKLLERFKTDQKYLDELIEFSEKNENSLYDYLEENLNAKIIGTLSNVELAKRYSEYIGKYTAFHLKQTPAWWIATPFVEKELKRLLAASGVKDIDAVVTILIDPLEYQSENFKEHMALLDIAIMAKKGKDVSKELEKHAKSYGSIPYGYATGVIWDVPHFAEKLNKELENDPETLKKSKLDEVKRKMKKRDELAFDLKLSEETLVLAVALRKLAYLQEIKKTTQTRSHPLLQEVVNMEIGKRLDLDRKYTQLMFVDEITKSLTDGSLSEAFRAELVERDRFSVIITENGKDVWLTGDDAKEFIRVNEIMVETPLADVIKGQVASRGFAKGRAKVCMSSTEIGKVEEGDILVTAMTTPDFVPAMRKAAAIVTNEGGVTCHAAIVSRELGKPCVIGTKIATKVLKDCDMVEVDAEKGIVKILK